jgi:hypothetical protein
VSTPATRAVEVPLLDLKAQYASIRDDVDAAVARVMESQYFILGPRLPPSRRKWPHTVTPRMASACRRAPMRCSLHSWRWRSAPATK